MALYDYDFLVGLASTFIITSAYELTKYIIGDLKGIIAFYKKRK